ncbi:MAG TPA: lipocalin-like domain-containing protein, partial [Steroidobacteraceae bacterium]|nr:lipocalin-like domain-containing protein [Steroidobacteraceae bacterium]
MRGAPEAALLAALLCGVCGGAVPPASPGAGSGDAAPAFARALAPRTFEFPQDHGPHPQFRHEWWYLTGNLDGAGGERFGFELTFFRYALAPPLAGAPPAGTSAWRTHEIYLAHFAVTDVAARRFRFAEKFSRAALGLAGARSDPLDVWIDDWRLCDAGVGPPGASRAPGGAGAPSALWRLQAAQPGYALELELHPLSAVVLNGEAGLSRKSAGSASYYYSIPRVAVRGRLLRGGAPLAVQGLAWFDREWGSGDLAASQSGWDWFALQLDDGTALMF